MGAQEGEEPPQKEPRVPQPLEATRWVEYGEPRACRPPGQGLARARRPPSRCSASHAACGDRMLCMRSAAPSKSLQIAGLCLRLPPPASTAGIDRALGAIIRLSPGAAPPCRMGPHGAAAPAAARVAVQCRGGASVHGCTMAALLPANVPAMSSGCIPGMHAGWAAPRIEAQLVPSAGRHHNQLLRLGGADRGRQGRLAQGPQGAEDARVSAGWLESC